MKRISIIIPVLNELEALQQYLPLLQKARAAGHELVLVDGGSRDGGIASAASFVDVVVASPPGRARQMNAGAEVARHELLLFLHVDTELPEDGLAQVQSAMAKLSAMWGRFDVRLSGARPAFRLIEFMINLRSRVSGVATGDQAIFVRASIFRRIGGFPDMPLMEDVALSKTLRRLASPVCLRERVTTSSRRWETQGVLRTVLLMWWLRLLYFLGVAPARLHAMYVKKK
ncbi:MAG: TIGR04283 family arsenosugar biosynthesis glycosyltransferase [Pseudohongiellaceae bacterium]